ncbi:hypothetical protein C6P46_002226 [Rhodotorula mucilaginosa]|uniref:Protection of telomeres protein 1 ssDNA-binding domain-containing protein n=1 Tax=Rhodotorula mucilaginosa TaxID=5537 RepID=A0A9P6VRW3_RHOMI|nr:hypothetical protein C6P46_002226 [Rhodotorula mucilaginosa]
MTTATPTAVVPLELSELAKPLPAALAAFRGRVVDLRPFSAHTQLAQFTLASIGTPADQQARAVVEIKGAWAENACKRITKGDVLVLTTKGVTLLNAHDDTEAKRPPRLRFEDGMTGWIQHRDGTEDLISYPPSSKKRSAQVEAPRKAENKRVAQAAAAESTGVGGAGVTAVPASSTRDAHASASTERRTAVSVQNKPSSRAVGKAPSSTRPSAAEPGSRTASNAPPLSAPAVNPDAVTPSLTTTTTDAIAIAIAEPVKSVVHSAPGEGSRSRKRQRREEALGWGLETENGGAYQSLAQVAKVVDTSDASTLQSKRTSVIALVTHAGPPYPPKQGARIANWYRQLRIADPTREAEAVELQWYATTEGGLPQVEVGQVLLVRHLHVRKLASSAPMLLCGSFSKLAHAVLDPDSLLRARRAAMTKNAQQSAPQPMEDVSHPDRLMVTPDVQETAYATRIAGWACRAKVLSTGIESARGAQTSTAAAAASGIDPKATNGAVMPPVVARPPRPLLRIGEIVIKLHTPRALGTLPSNIAASLYLTDYTPHPLLHDYPDPSPVTLPGRLTFQVSLFGSTAAPLAPLLDPRTGETKRGRLVWIRNVRVKLNPHNELEGTVMEDTNPRFRAKVSVEVIDMRRKDHQEKWGDRAKEFQKRHRDYWSARSLIGGKAHV